ncbi:Zn-ribbon domain-containing OB-fold protein [Verminephrobacter eiseniae]|uniref:Zn-ribbon domain-containing OB-fold protein n=1 Tax=Verminephrobacter eiseniae TaxID=364317 RepID=UPI0010EA3011|nr:zinc ribbon domain-containing protein [Verminephrobacter eiseniae]KAB7619277.1 DNA-binding protein [Verminephrobacter sp. Larva24]MCW5230244.1 DNA-binding protein [Verminephrobacter eiseniae]MCW5291977.1 DNA-binding protein [Verminephrobacter eiseniae]MCW8185804.1 DNA-binding protein [Verminephrobacter eiseniae]MCW8224686.1 DNA-binding protein [Verminephrobacter eiseniae]
MSEPSASPEARFHAALVQGRFEVQWCKACARAFFFPRPHCPHCHGADHEWRPSTGVGTLYSHSEIPASSKTPGRNVILVDMDDGSRMMSTLLDACAADLQIGLRVQASIDRLEDKPRVVFRRMTT